MRAIVLILLLALAVASGCIYGGSKGPRGTNTTVGTGSSNDGPWSGGTTAAEVQR
ncbi:MAG TPA: hypothetical protein VLB44_22570 [Kofleriaceae bacterium]|nr:hypothetical protein [Kofleriaceae bacterium]